MAIRPVVSFVLLLCSLLAGCSTNYDHEDTTRRERALRQDLFEFRSTIDQYTADKHKRPQSLSDLVDAGYLKQLPVDPFTGSNKTWLPVSSDEQLLSKDDQGAGIIDVRSGSDAKDKDGMPYSKW